jgi:hypothetical protein
MAPFRQDKEAGRWASAAGLETLDGKGLHEMRFEMSLFRPENIFTKKKGQKRKRILTAARGEFRGIKVGPERRQNRLFKRL